MQHQIQALIHEALTKLQQQNTLAAELQLPTIQIERCRQPEHGDFASNIALLLAKPCRMPPRQLAEHIVQHLTSATWLQQVSVAGPGFINFKLQASAQHELIRHILTQGIDSCILPAKKPQRIHLEFVSANPTGPLHVGHGRSAAYGSCVAALLRATGHQVHCEYYVNDAGRQIRILGLSTWLRYCAAAEPGLQIAFPAGAYQGDYILRTAQEILEHQQQRFSISQLQYDKMQAAATEAIASLPQEAQKDALLDELIMRAKELLGENEFNWIADFTLEDILDDIKQDLAEFGVEYNAWFRESALVANGSLNDSINLLSQQNYVYTKDDAKWFAATELGDEKDRVLIRANGQPTYFASDVAYHLYKYAQGYTHMIDIFGADHHGYIARIKAFLKGLKRNPNQLKILLVQFAILYRGTEKVSMSTRSGEFVTLRTLRHEVGNDATRYFYIMRKPEQHLDFDLELAKSRSNENPVYYIQYAHARICQVLQQATGKDITFQKETAVQHLELLDLEHEQHLITAINKFPEVISKAANEYAPHLLTNYLQQLATAFHSYYNASTFLVAEQKLCQARLGLICATREVIKHALTLLGISAPQRM